jgi:RNA polymerase sigma-70 factor (ECF subfamily)
MMKQVGGNKLSSPHEVTQLLIDCANGDQAAPAKLFPLVYDELHRLASSYMRRERRDHTLQTTALVHEAYLRLAGQQNLKWQSRAHFFAVAAQVMRNILIDYARAHGREKRGGGDVKVSLDDAAILSDERAADLIALDEALTGLAELDRRKAQIVEMRFFGGLSNDEIAEVLRISANTVMRDWRVAKAWLYKEISRRAG